MRSVQRGIGAVTAALRDAGGTTPVLDIAGVSHSGTDGVDTEIASVAGSRCADAVVRRAAPRHGGLELVLTSGAAA